jgi:hypothetical protein
MDGVEKGVAHMANYGKTGSVHRTRFNPKTGKNDVFFGPKGTKAGHAVVDGKTGRLEYLRGAGKGVKPSRNTGRFLGHGK